VTPLTEGNRVRLAEDYAISPVIVGGWQLSRGHGAGFPAGENPRRFLSELVPRGFTTFDCADIYTGVEELLGDFLRHHRASGSGQPVQVHTKFVPDLDVLPTIHRAYVERIIHRSLARLGVEALDLVQFHWWDFGIPGYVEVMGWLEALKKEGKIRHLAVTNFDIEHLAELVDAGADVIADQVQYSVLDRRPKRALTPFCLEHGIALLCYGALAGGFLTGRYLGLSEPPRELENRSLVKYRLIIDEMGGWARYRVVLETLAEAASRSGVSIAAAALRWVLERPAVAATVTGIDSLAQADELRAALEMTWDPETKAELDEVLDATPVPPGPVYGVERVIDGPHGAIMRYNLNRG
jgi:aryl-alcohol dehydrogenase-like predicted oxidoreductase